MTSPLSDSALGLKAQVLNLPGLAHVFTTRMGGVSTGEFASLNLKYPVDDKDETGGDAHVTENRRRVCESLNLPFERMVACQQVHEAVVQTVTSAEAGRGARSHADGFPGTDGLLSAEAGIALMVMVADCYPVLMADPVRRVAAAVHSGWRGTQKGIAVVALEQMIAQGCKPGDIRLAIGPGIGYARFEVGPEVVAAFGDAIDASDPQVCVPQPDGSGKYRLNLPEILRRQALAAGLDPAHVEIVPGCTLSDERFYSYRRQQGVTGRQAGLIGWVS